MLGGFFGKVFGGFVVVVLVVGFLVYSYALPGVEEQVHRDVEKHVAQEAELLAEVIALAWDATEQRFELGSLESLAERLHDPRLTIVNIDGVVLFDSHEQAASMDNHLDRAEIQRLRVPVTRFSDTRAEIMVYQACPVLVEGQIRAFARVAVSTDDRESRMADLRRAIRSGVLTAFQVSLLVAFVIARYLSRPLAQISNYVGELRKGAGAQQLKISGSHEFAKLASAINSLTEEIENQIACALADKAEREAILSAMADGLVAVDEDQKVLLINGAGLGLLSVQLKDPVGVPIWALHRAPSWKRLLKELAAQRPSSDQPRSALCLLPREESELQLEVTAVAYSAPGGKGSGTVFVLRDVTELRRLEAVRSDFVSNVSHELKTPMTAMRGFLDVVLASPKMDGSQRTHFIRKALRNTEQLSSIVTDLLALSRLESEEHRLRFEDISLQELLRAVAEESQDLAESKGIEVSYGTPEAPLMVHADERALRMALLNLVTNAIRYSPDGGQVQVSASSLSGTPKQAVMEVRDQGPGIPHSERERVFERFYRVDKARTRKLGGTGLGLAIVRHVMATHGGRVELESELGQGSCFRLVLDQASEA